MTRVLMQGVIALISQGSSPVSKFMRKALAEVPIIGREEPNNEENSAPVLTDKICLIPGDEPVVRVEDAPGNARRIFTGVDIRARVEDVWAVLTDYGTLNTVVPNLLENDIIQHLDGGGARLWQVGRSTWKIFGRAFHFQAGTTLEVRLHPNGICASGWKTAGEHICASTLSSLEARDEGRKTALVRDIFPRPFSIHVPGVPVRDITMQNVLGARGDFVHYQGVWRLQPLEGCAQPGQDMMRLTFAVECEPHWFLPVAPVEGKIAAALVENMVAIRDHVEEFVSRRGRQAEEAAETAEVESPSGAEGGSSSSSSSRRREGPPWPPGSFEEAFEWLSSVLDLPPQVIALTIRRTGSSRTRTFVSASTSSLAVSKLAGGRTSFFRRLEGRQSSSRRRVVVHMMARAEFSAAELGAQWSAEMLEALSRAELRLFERAEVGEIAAAAEPVAGSMFSFGELSGPLAGVAEAVVGFELETAFAASAAAGVAAVTYMATRSPTSNAFASAQDSDGEDTEESSVKWAWRHVLEQHPEAVAQGQFLGVPFGREDVERRWPRFFQTLDITEEQALKIIEMDVTPLLVESENVGEILGRLAAISSREKALQLVGMNPSLLVGGVADQERHKGYGVSTIVDVLYAGRLRQVIEEGGRDNEGKVAEIEFYSCILSSCRPIVEVIQKSLAWQDASAATRRLFKMLRNFMPNDSMRVLLGRVAETPDPWAYLLDQTRAGLSMASNLAIRPRLTTSMMPHYSKIIAKLPSIYTRLSILRPHIPRIIGILDPYLDVVEPHLDRIMERMDRIEPHLPYILLHLDVLAPHCGKLLDYFDVLMPYADDKEKVMANLGSCYARPGVASLKEIEDCVLSHWTDSDKWDDQPPSNDVEMQKKDQSYLPRLLPYVDFLIPHLEELAPHLSLVHPHLPHILPHMDILLPYILRFVKYPRASANADVLIAYLGWMLYVPVLPRVLNLPLVPRIVSKLSTWLPRWAVRRTLVRNLRRDEEEQERRTKRKRIEMPDEEEEQEREQTAKRNKLR